MIKFRRNNKTISGRLHEEIVLMDMKQGMYFSLNPVASRIWDLLEESKEIEELCKSLSNEYDVDYEKCCLDVEEYLNEMVKMGLVYTQ